MNERSENTNKKSKKKMPVEAKREDRLGVVDVGLRFISVVEELSRSDGQKSGPPGLFGWGL